MKFSKLIVTLVIALNALFTAATLLVFAKTAKEPTGLITAWFTFTTGELWMLSKIKRTKLAKGGDSADENPDDSN